MTLNTSKQLTVLSIATILLMTFLDFYIIKDGLTYIRDLRNADEDNKFGLQLAAANFIFKSIGIILIIVATTDLLRYKGKPTLTIKILWTYSLIGLLLLLPLYHRHEGLGGGPQIHGHSFWDGGGHMH